MLGRDQKSRQRPEEIWQKIQRRRQKIETKESEMTSQENKLRELGYNEDDIEKILNVLKK